MQSFNLLFQTQLHRIKPSRLTTFLLRLLQTNISNYVKFLKYFNFYIMLHNPNHYIYTVYSLCVLHQVPIFLSIFKKLKGYKNIQKKRAFTIQIIFLFLKFLREPKNLGGGVWVFYFLPYLPPQIQIPVTKNTSGQIKPKTQWSAFALLHSAK